MMEQQVRSLIEETLLVVVVKLIGLDRQVEELRMNCKFVEKVMTAVVDTKKCCIESCCLDKKRCDDDWQPIQVDPDTFHASSVPHFQELAPLRLKTIQEFGVNLDLLHCHSNDVYAIH
ncbi:hypothetical protein Tco_0926596 [Tanacetum coccineum]|uniref:Uncharacterized protein n=1 Tax=Tanacetum coccineum TaxID=301880 RepID=A0ABQ5DB19_9ASTR